MEKKVLNLVVANKWYDMIASGEKNEEYRTIKAYYINRLVEAKSEGSDEEYRKVSICPEFDIFISNAKFKELLEKKTARFIHFTHVRFFKGYSKTRQSIEKEIESITIGEAKKGLCPNEWVGVEFIVIKFK